MRTIDCKAKFYLISSSRIVLSQISIGTQQVTLNALQVVTLATLNATSGITVTGSKPFAAYSGNMCGAFFLQAPSCDHIMVCVTILTLRFLKVIWKIFRDNIATNCRMGYSISIDFVYVR